MNLTLKAVFQLIWAVICLPYYLLKSLFKRKP